jgi:hypothetical protein
MSVPKTSESRLREFLRSIENVDWLGSATEPSPDVVVCSDFTDAWDVWRRADVWAGQTHSLERRARESIGEKSIDDVFEVVSEYIRESVWQGIGRYLEAHVRQGNISDEGLSYDVLEDIKRDVSWAAIEALLDEQSFFHRLLAWYRQGRWPCGWNGDFPAGSLVVL